MSQQTTIQNHFQLGQKAFEEHNYDHAITQYQNSIDIAPNNSKTYYWCGRAFYRLKRYNEAISQYQESLKNDPNKAKTYYWCGRAFYGLKRYNEAISQYQESIDIDPNHAETYYWLGRARFELGKKNFDSGKDDEASWEKDFCEAIAQYRNSIAIDSDNTDTYYWLGRACFELGKKNFDSNKDNQAYQEKALNRYYEAIIEYQNSIAIDSHNADTYYWCGKAHYFLGEDEEAFKKYKKSIELKSDELNSEYKADAYYHIGVYFDQIRRYEKAVQQYEKFIEKYERLIQKEPLYIDVHYWLGKDYYYLGEDEEAVKHLETFIEKYKQLEKEKTIDIDNVVKQLKYKYIDSCYWLGLARYIKNVPDGKTVEFKEFLKQNLPNIEDALVDKYIDLGIGFIDLKKYEQATNYFKQAIVQLNKIESLFDSIKHKTQYFEKRIKAKSYCFCSITAKTI